jgi:oxygen-independent coproporphyrinogen-3 oxidase
MTLNRQGEASLMDTVEIHPEDRHDTKSALKRLLYGLLSQDTGKTLPWGTLTGIRPTKIAMGLIEEGMSDEDTAACMEKEYLVSEKKAKLSVEIAEREKYVLRNIDYQNGYSLYVGIPFCPTTCLYCSFTSYPLGRYGKRADEYVAAVEKELAYTAEAFKDKKLNTVYFGGGTPTTLTAEQLDHVLTFIEEHFDFQYLQEFTVEAGRPDSITREKLEVLRKHKISRISINPQTMKQATLDLIGRHHTVDQIRETYYLARELGFDNINMDLILGLPGETIEDVQATMEELKVLKPDNITVHSLAIKRAARLNIFWEQYAHMTMENSDETMAVAADAAASLGMKPYYLYRQKNMAGNLENVGFAKPGLEGIYNILIMEEKQSIVACGAGATTKAVFPDGRIERADNVKDIEQYLARVDEMIERKRKLYGD